MASTSGLRNQLLTVRAISITPGVSTATVYRLVLQGHLPHVRIGNAIRVRADDLVTFSTGKAPAR